MEDVLLPISQPRSEEQDVHTDQVSPGLFGSLGPRRVTLRNSRMRLRKIPAFGLCLLKASFAPKERASEEDIHGRLILIHLRCWEVLPFLTIQRQRCVKFRVLRGGNFHTPLPLNCQKGQHLPAPEVYKNQSPNSLFLYAQKWPP